jgi:hypothetical protein
MWVKIQGCGYTRRGVCCDVANDTQLKPNFLVNGLSAAKSEGVVLSASTREVELGTMTSRVRHSRVAWCALLSLIASLAALGIAKVPSIRNFNGDPSES